MLFLIPKPKTVKAVITPVIATIVLTGCGQAKPPIVAKMSHNFNGNFELYSFQAKPSEEIGQAEAIAKKQYGNILSDVKSPLTRFMCLWRNTKSGAPDGDVPEHIFLTCSFSSEFVASPKSLVEMAELYNRFDRGNLKAKWELKNENYRLTRFEVELSAAGKSYRSQNLAKDMSQVKVDQSELNFPKDANQPFSFVLNSELPFRHNSGEKQNNPIVSMSFSGTAEPVPDWVNY